MTDELKKLVVFILKLATAGTLCCIVLLIMPIITSHIDGVSAIFRLFGSWSGVIILFTVTIVLISIYSLLTISQALSHIGIYHKLKINGTENGEPFWIKVRKVLWWNCILTIFIFITIVNIIQPSTEILQKDPYFTQNDIAFLCATMLIPGYLLSLRLLANPGKWIINFPFRGRFTQSDAISESVKIFKERILSFYFSLIGIVFMYLVIRYIYDGTIGIAAGISPEQTFSNIIDVYVPHLPILLIGILPYLIALILTTIIGELILKYAEPIVQI